MTLKEEIEKLIRVEREKLEAREQKHTDYHGRQRERFVPVSTLLQQLSVSVEPDYLKLHLHDASAILELGRERDGYFRSQLRCTVEPNFAVQAGAAPGESLFREEPGFRLDETHYFHEPEYDTSERTVILSDEADLAEYLAQKIAEHVAHCRHLKSLAQRNRSEQLDRARADETRPSI